MFVTMIHKRGTRLSTYDVQCMKYFILQAQLNICGETSMEDFLRMEVPQFETRVAWMGPNIEYNKGMMMNL